MNTSEAANAIGTTPRTLRQFLRSPSSTFKAVGSGSRYDFKESELPTLTKRFAEWSGTGKPKAEPRRVTRATVLDGRLRRSATAEEVQAARDAEVWAEEGDVVLPDIRDPHILRRVRADEAAREARLMMTLMAKGLHITQLGDRR